MKKMKKGFKYGMLLTLLASASLALVNPVSTEAASEISQEVVDILDNANISLASGVTYVDSTGKTVEIPVPTTTQIRVNSTPTRIQLVIGRQTINLTNVREMYFKNVTVTNYVNFNSSRLTKFTLENTRFQRGVEFGRMPSIEQLVVKDSYFGATNYGIFVHDNANLSTLVVDNSTLQGDLRISRNKSLAKSTVSNSVLKDDAIQDGNKVWYYTDFIGTKIERPRSVRAITSGGRSADDIFFMNPDPNTEIGASRFDGSTPGTIYYTLANGYRDTITVPVGVAIVDIRNRNDLITVKFSTGQEFNLGNPREIYFRNANIYTNQINLSRQVGLETLKFVNCYTGIIQVNNSQTLKNFEMHGSEIVQSAGFISLANNRSLENFIIQDSKIKGTAGNITVAQNRTLNNFIMNNVYVLGRLNTQNLGSTVLKISNSQFDDSITSNNEIWGEEARQVAGFAPTLDGTSFRENKDLIKNETDILDRLNVKAEDIEDGDITDNVVIADHNLEFGTPGNPGPGDYKVIIEVTDSDLNTVRKEITISLY